MSTLALFAIGSVVFAITVYGAVMAGGIALTQRAQRETAIPRPDALDDSGIATDHH